MKINGNDQHDITNELQEVVDKFNEKYTTWMRINGCRASFGWKYGTDDTIKTMDIQAIDAIVYRKPPPGSQALKDSIDKINPSKEK